MDELQLFISHIGEPVYLAHHYGALFYLITFFWTAIEGETFVIIGGLLAQKGYINIEGLFIAAWLGSFFGDQVVFVLGRRYGERILLHFPKITPSVHRAIRWLDRYAIAFILSYRFIYGVRNVSGVAVGMSHMPWRKFALWNCIAAFVWAMAFVGFGYLYGNVLSHMHHKQQVVTDSVRQVMLAMLGLFALIVIIKLITIRMRRARHAREMNHKP